MKRHRATWYITLDCVCPGCETEVDLLEYSDFWDGRTIKVGEWGTDATSDMEVTCPKCYHEFIVDLEY